MMPWTRKRMSPPLMSGERVRACDLQPSSRCSLGEFVCWLQMHEAGTLAVPSNRCSLPGWPALFSWRCSLGANLFHETEGVMRTAGPVGSIAAPALSIFGVTFLVRERIWQCCLMHIAQQGTRLWTDSREFGNKAVPSQFGCHNSEVGSKTVAFSC